MVQFSERREPTASDKVVYVDGGFDMFHVGHIEFLREARKHGTYLIGRWPQTRVSAEFAV